MIYIDLNMVRAGVVAHPSEWPWSGYNEIQNPRHRYALINHAKLRELLGFHDHDTFAEHHRQWVHDALSKNSHLRESRWAGYCLNITMLAWSDPRPQQKILLATMMHADVRR